MVLIPFCNSATDFKVRRKNIRYVPQRVPGRVEHFCFERADLDLVALADGFVDMGNAVRLVARRHHPAFVMRLELADAGGVIGVMMGHQNVGQFPSGLLQRGLDRSGFWRIDRSRRSRGRVVDEDAEIVGKTGE